MRLGRMTAVVFSTWDVDWSFPTSVLPACVLPKLMIVKPMALYATARIILHISAKIYSAYPHLKSVTRTQRSSHPH